MDIDKLTDKQIRYLVYKLDTDFVSLQGKLKFITIFFVILFLGYTSFDIWILYNIGELARWW